MNYKYKCQILIYGKNTSKKETLEKVKLLRLKIKKLEIMLQLKKLTNKESKTFQSY